MSIEAASTLVSILGAYAAIGVLVGLIVVTVGAKRIDPATAGMPLQARAIILPGAAVLWPLMLVKLFTQKEPPLS
ncbi:MAG: hypothetical protein AAFW65_01630 [Pseudomonadota bacterium]